MSDDPILPVVQGDWVARSGGGDFEVARVRQAYYEDGKVYCDLVPYSLAGENIGRQSPACGGPKAFEPWCRYTDNGWQRIEKPDFPLKRELLRVPAGEGRVRLEMSIFHDGRGGAKAKAERTKPRKQSSDYPRAKVRIIQVPGLPSNAPEVEAAALRRAAQELRDQHRDLKRVVGEDKIAYMITRAEQLEAEAATLSG